MNSIRSAVSTPEQLSTGKLNAVDLAPIRELVAEPDDLRLGPPGGRAVHLAGLARGLRDRLAFSNTARRSPAGSSCFRSFGLCGPAFRPPRQTRASDRRTGRGRSGVAELHAIRHGILPSRSRTDRPPRRLFFDGENFARSSAAARLRCGHSGLPPLPTRITTAVRYFGKPAISFPDGSDPGRGCDPRAARTSVQRRHKGLRIGVQKPDAEHRRGDARHGRADRGNTSRVQH